MNPGLTVPSVLPYFPQVLVLYGLALSRMFGKGIAHFLANDNTHATHAMRGYTNPVASPTAPTTSMWIVGVFPMFIRVHFVMISLKPI